MTVQFKAGEALPATTTVSSSRPGLVGRLLVSAFRALGQLLARPPDVPESLRADVGLPPLERFPNWWDLPLDLRDPRAAQKRRFIDHE